MNILFRISTNSLEKEQGLLEEGRRGEEPAQGLAAVNPENVLPGRVNVWIKVLSLLVTCKIESRPILGVGGHPGIGPEQWLI